MVLGVLATDRLAASDLSLLELAACRSSLDDGKEEDEEEKNNTRGVHDDLEVCKEAESSCRTWK